MTGLIVIGAVVFLGVIIYRAYENRNVTGITKKEPAEVKKESSEENASAVKETIEVKKEIKTIKRLKDMPSGLKWAFVLFVLQIIGDAGQITEKYLNEGYDSASSTMKSLASAIGGNVFLIIGIILCYKYYKDN